MAGNTREIDPTLVNKSARGTMMMSPEMMPAAYLHRYSDLEMQSQYVTQTFSVYCSSQPHTCAQITSCHAGPGSVRQGNRGGH